MRMLAEPRQGPTAQESSIRGCIESGAEEGNRVVTKNPKTDGGNPGRTRPETQSWVGETFYSQDPACW